VLLATRSKARELFLTALHDDVEVIEAETFEAAVASLKANSLHLICCTVRFDESRMFDLLRWVRAECAHIPVVCARALPKDLSRVSIEAVRIAAESLGAATFIDVPALAERHGQEGARRRLRRALLEELARSLKPESYLTA